MTEGRPLEPNVARVLRMLQQEEAGWPVEPIGLEQDEIKRISARLVRMGLVGSNRRLTADGWAALRRAGGP
jgi:hypothetical protein